jgi:polyhydroxyalkanoate synthase
VSINLVSSSTHFKCGHTRLTSFSLVYTKIKTQLSIPPHIDLVSMSWPVESKDTPDALHKRLVYTCKTRDNYTLTMQRCCACTTEGTIIAHTQTHPVILCHGFASNRFTFDLNTDVSVANYLADKGWDTWLIELRGSGKNNEITSNKPTSLVRASDWLDVRSTTAGSRVETGEHRHDWDFSDHVEDCRAIIAYVNFITSRPVHFIGHSMGAMLLQCCAGGESGKKRMIRSGVHIAGAVVMESSHWTYFKWLWPIVKHFGTIHPEYIQKVLAPLSFGFNNYWEELFFHHKNVDAQVACKMFRKNWEPISTALIDQLRFCVEKSGIYKQDGTRYSTSLKSIKSPQLILAGTVDEQCHAVNMVNLNKIMSGCSVYKLIGKASGHEEEYGHFDLIVGKNAKVEVWDIVSNFLEKHDSV